MKTLRYTIMVCDVKVNRERLQVCITGDRLKENTLIQVVFYIHEANCQKLLGLKAGDVVKVVCVKKNNEYRGISFL